MEKEVFISLYLDTRRLKSNNLYPVKVRVFTPSPRKQNLYPTKFDLTKRDFESIWETVKPRNDFKELRMEMQAVEMLAIETAKKIIPFNFEQFEKKLFRGKGEGQNVFYQFELALKRLTDNNQLNTATNYSSSLASLKLYILETTSKEPRKLLFNEITPLWLEKYENFMINTKQRSSNTVSIYIRALRTLFNVAIEEKEIDRDIYPFGKRKYQVPAVKRVKKALNKSDLKILMEANAKTPEQIKARDFWFFSYTCSGMNIKDIALLRHKDLVDGKITFYRAKTINTAKTDLRPVVVHLTDYAQMIIKKYGNKVISPKQLIFSIISDGDNEMEKRKKIQNFTRFVNQAIKKVAKANNLNSAISTNWARHSFATNTLRAGQSMEYVGEALGHANMKTTQGYFAGFEDESKKEFMESLMQF